ncbi:hypothetical protein N7461_009535 [Penicillium sp. DV-2018c]|nr:hypothetical protein N7461_009535 [Penicillium sp. DV-2018c]
MARHDDITIVYDNFNYVQKVRHRTTAVYRKMYHYTTAKLVRRGNLIPEGGLLQSMLNRELPIRFMHDIAMSSDFKVSDTWISIQKRCIFNAINAAHPSAVAKIYSGAEDRRPSMPQLDILPCTPTKHLTMGPILENGATDTGTYRVLENIFAKQLGLDEQSAIRGRLYPIYGNQETCTLIRQCQRMMEMEIEEGSQPIYWLRCVLPVTGFWNLRQNYLNVVQKTFWGPENYNGQFSTLYAHMHHLNRPDIPNDGAPVHDLEELVLFSFDARIVAMLYAKIGDKCDVKSSEKIDAYLSSLDVEGFHNVIDSIHAELFASDVRRRCSTVYRETAEGSVTAVDIEAVNTIRYLQVVEVYVVLKYAIKHGDLGLLRICITKCLLTFHGMSSLKYAREVLHLYRLVSTEAAAPELRRALLGCGLVNLRGQPDSFFETDRLVELQNLQIKELMRNRGSSSADISHVFKSCLSTANYHLPLRAEFELAFGERTESGELPNVDESTNLEESPNPNESDSEDPAESRAFDLHSLGELLSQDVLEDKQRTIHHVQFAAPDMIHLGQVRIAEGPSIDRVNEELNGCPWGFDEEEDEETEEEYGRGVKTDHMVSSAEILL